MKLLAPNGKPSNLTPEQYKLVRTPEFKAWFGDWENSPETASKVVDENGEPLILWHGSKSKERFKTFNIISKTHRGEEVGSHFGTYGQAYKFIEQRKKNNLNYQLYCVFLNIRNILKVDDILWWTPNNINKYVFLKNNISIHDNPMVNEIIENLNKNKINGFKYSNLEEGEGFSYSVFDSNNVKILDGSNNDIRYKNGGLTMKKPKANLAPNGKPSNLTPEQYRLVRTPAFKKWFGDWENSPETASKVVDENGEPLVVFHGTESSNSILASGVFIPYGSELNEFYFTNNINTALSYTYDSENIEFDEEEGFNTQGNIDDVIKVFLNIKNPKVKDFKGKTFTDFWNIKKDNDGNIFTNVYDVLSIDENLKRKDYLGNNYIVYKSEQIKLADGTNTTFDGSNTDIRFDKGGLTMKKPKQLLAPNGKPSNLTPEQYKLVRTPEFKAWFGDWENSPETASKVVDENGEPLVVYHGSRQVDKNTKFNIFNIGDGAYGKGIYFTSSEKEATGWALGNYVYNVFLNIRNPFTETLYKKWLPHKTQSNEFDGIIQMDFKNVSMVLAFEPNQIKLADGSNTTFDGSNPDIRFDDGGDLKINFDTLEEYEKWITDKIQEQGKEVFIKSEEYRVAYPRYRKLWNEKHKKVAQKKVVRNKIGFIARAFDKKGNVSMDLHDPIEEKFTSFTQGNIRAKELAKNIFKKYKKVDEIIFDFIPLDINGEVAYDDHIPRTINYNRDNIRFDDGGDITFDKGGLTMKKPKQLLAPNGKPSNLTPEQYRLVRTPAFKKWFGDWENSPETASKVVDENGEPLVVWHGSKNKFNVFDKSNVGSNSPLKDDKGFFFTSSEKEAKEYGEAINFFISIKNPLIDDTNDKYYTSAIYYWDMRRKTYIEQSKENDGVFVLSSASNMYVAFEPNQIKLANGTNTTFDGSNPDIRFDKGGLTMKKPKQLLAPNGKPSNLTPEQYRLVRTPAFKKWFGDWENSPETASKVVDYNGEPLPVYHGTDKQFNIFSSDYFSGSTKAVLGYLGFYFTDDKEIAIDFTRKKFPIAFEKKLSFKKNARVLNVFLNMRNPTYITISDFFKIDWDNRDKESILKYKNKLIKSNIDGIIIEKATTYSHKKMREFNGNQYIILQDNKNIKLADGTNTTFDSNNPDIRFKDGGIFHGSPHKFERFTTEMMGSGEGNLTFGWGLYFTDKKEIAEHYKSALENHSYYVDGNLVTRENSTDIYYSAVTAIHNQGYEKSIEVADDSVDNGADKVWVNEYKKTLKELKNKKVESRGDGYLYEVTLHKGKSPDQYDWLIWDKPVSENQSEKILIKSKEEGYVKSEKDLNWFKNHLKSGSMIYDWLRKSYTNKIGHHVVPKSADKEASLFLLSLGIDGIKYPAESTTTGETSDTSKNFNYVVFDEKDVSIYGIEQYEEGGELIDESTGKSIKKVYVSIKIPKETGKVSRDISDFENYFKYEVKSIGENPFKELKEHKLNGILGVSSSDYNVNQWLVHRDCLVLMPIKEFIEQNKTEQVKYTDVDYLTKDGLEIFYRLYDRKDREPYDYYAILQRLLPKIQYEFTLEEKSTIDNNKRTALNNIARIFDIYWSSKFMTYLSEKRRINSLNDFAELTLEYLNSEQISSDYYLYDTEYDINDLIEPIKRGIVNSAKIYADESEWLILDKQLKIPNGSQLFFVLGGFFNQKDKIEELISKYNLRDTYKISFIEYKNIENLSQKRASKQDEDFKERLENSRKTINLRLKKYMSSTLVDIIDEIDEKWEAKLVDSLGEEFRDDEGNEYNSVFGVPKFSAIHDEVIGKFIEIYENEIPNFIENKDRFVINSIFSYFLKYLEDYISQKDEVKTDVTESRGYKISIYELIQPLKYIISWDIDYKKYTDKAKVKLGSDLYRFYGDKEINFKDGGLTMRKQKKQRVDFDNTSVVIKLVGYGNEEEFKDPWSDNIIPKNPFFAWLYNDVNANEKISSGQYDLAKFKNSLGLFWDIDAKDYKGGENIISLLAGRISDDGKKIYILTMTTNPIYRRSGSMSFLIRKIREKFNIEKDNVYFVGLTAMGKKFHSKEKFDLGGTTMRKPKINFKDGGLTKKTTMKKPNSNKLTLKEVKETSEKVGMRVNEIKSQFLWHEGKSVDYPITENEKKIIQNGLPKLRKERERLYKIYSDMKDKKQGSIRTDYVSIKLSDVNFIYAVRILGNKYILNFSKLNNTQRVDNQYYSAYDLQAVEKQIEQQTSLLAEKTGDYSDFVNLMKLKTDEAEKRFDRPQVLLQFDDEQGNLIVVELSQYLGSIKDRYADFKVIYSTSAFEVPKEKKITEADLEPIEKQAIKDVLTLSEYSRLTQEETEYVYSKFKNYESLVDEHGEYVAEAKEPYGDKNIEEFNDLMETLYKKGVVIHDSYNETIEAYQNTINLVNSVRGRIETLSAKKSGTDLFPEADSVNQNENEEIESIKGAIEYLQTEYDAGDEDSGFALDYLKDELRDIVSQSATYASGGEIKYFEIHKGDKPVLKVKFKKDKDESSKDKTIEMLDKLSDRGYHFKEVSEAEYKKFDYSKVDNNDVVEFMSNSEHFENGGKIKFNKKKVPSSRIYNYALKIKTKYPKIWFKGGNIFGNQAFKNLEKVIKRGYWLESERWMFIKWQSYVARHHKDYRIEGTIAMLKWLNTTDKGWDYMKDLIEEEIKKQSEK